MTRTQLYAALDSRISAILADERDEIAVMATLVGELHGGIDYFHWTGFYRVTAPRLLKIGPYQGGHGCLTIPFERGVCGQCAREEKTVIVPDVTLAPHHIACSTTTRSEIVVPVFDSKRRVRAVLDVDSDHRGAFDATDAEWLERFCRYLLPVYGESGEP